MVLAALPSSISPSKVVTFTDCPRLFQYQAIERLEQPPTEATLKGTLVHAALEALFVEPPERRTLQCATDALRRAADTPLFEEAIATLALDDKAFLADAVDLVGRYFDLEDPTTIDAIGIELGLETRLEGSRGLGDVRLRGIIDRLDRLDDGRLVVVDYKTGRAPGERFERGSLGGVQTYALLCESMLGRAPAAVRLLYLREPVAITAVASEQSIRGQRKRAVAVWSAIERACDAEDFRPHVGPLCDYCNFKASCPAFAA